MINFEMGNVGRICFWVNTRIFEQNKQKLHFVGIFMKKMQRNEKILKKTSIACAFTTLSEPIIEKTNKNCAITIISGLKS
jgi:hypothetical protein